MTRTQVDKIYQKLQQNDIQSAAILAENLYREHPNNSHVVCCFGTVALAAKDYSSAAQILAIACQLNPQSVDPHYNLGLAYQELGQYNKAIELYGKALKLDTKHLPSIANSAVCHEKLSLWNEAIKLNQQAVQIAPNQLDILNNYANLYRKMKDFQKSKQMFKEIIQKHRDNPQSHLNFAQLLFEMADYSDASLHFEKYSKLNPEDPKIDLWRGETYLKLNQLQSARQYFQKCLAKEQTITRAKLGMANLLLIKNDYAAAEQQVNQILNHSPQNKVARYTLAMIYSHQTDHTKLDQSALLLQRLISDYPDYHLAFDCLARVLIKQGLAEQSIDHAKKSLALEPGLVDYQMTLQDAYTHSGRIIEAHTLLAKIVQTAPELAAAIRQKGILELRLKQTHQAVRSLKKAVTLAPEDQRSLAHYIIALQANNEFEEASKLQSFEQLVFNEYLKPQEIFGSLQSFNLQLESEIKAHPSLRWEPKGLATKGGSMTENLVNETSPALAVLVRMILETIEYYRLHLAQDEAHPFLGKIPENYKLHLWGLVLKEKGHVGPHIHEDSWISGAYYVKLPQLGKGDKQQDYQGWIEFGQPHQEIPYHFKQQNYPIKPTEGKLLLFPSYYFHQTIPYSDPNERISIAFDVETI